MGLANLVPGVSGGTMILVFGLYEEFIGAFSDLTRLRFSLRAIAVLGLLFGISVLTIFGLAGVIQFLMEMFLPGMLALFIGMTLGGAPALFRQLKPLRAAPSAFIVAGFLFMAIVAFVLKPDVAEPGWLLYFTGGIVGSAAMILPGISGSYLLLVMGLYLPIIAAISEFVDALRGLDIALAIQTGLHVILPVGLGVLTGLVVLANALKILLQKYHQLTLGFLLGLLLGSVLGLYPFQERSFDKLPRYAVATEEGERELRIMGFGWEASEDSVIYRNLKSLERDNLRVAIVSTTPGETISPEDLRRAREDSAVVIAYDLRVPKGVRREAANKASRVVLEIVPDTRFTPARGILTLVLALAGFAATFHLSRMKR